jgi:hypothetical protein
MKTFLCSIRNRCAPKFGAAIIGAVFALGAHTALSATGSQTFLYTGGPQAFTVPTGVYKIKIEVVGAGGSGGYNGTGGGGGGGYSSGILAVTAGETLVVGVGGSNGIYGGSGGMTSVERGSTTLISATGGGNGITVSNPNVGGGGAGGVGVGGSVNHTGGSGGGGYYTYYGGGGGGAGGPTANGGNGGDTTTWNGSCLAPGGTAGTGGGAPGGNGGKGSGYLGCSGPTDPAGSGGNYGGGGGGGNGNGSTPGSGANGYCLVSWTTPVVNTNDSGAGSLRQALLDAQDGDSIGFNIPTSDSGYNAGVWTITLTSGELVIDKNVTIDGTGAATLAVDGNAASRVLYIAPGKLVTISGLTIRNGAANDTSSFFTAIGGGIYNDRATLTLSNCSITGNTAVYYGGGIYNDSGTLTLNNSAVSGNSGPALGGGIYSGGSSGSATVTLNKSTITSNSASVGAGIYSYAAGATISVVVNSSTFSANSAFVGGGIYNDGNSGHASVTVTNSTLSGNSANAGGGGLYNDDGPDGNATATINNTTFSGNNSSSGGAIYNAGTLDIANSILKSGSGANIYYSSGTITSHGYNLSSDDGSGFLIGIGDQINTDPILGPLKDNGGPTLTHAPLSNSPAIDRGKDIGGTGQDQRGSLRPVTYNDPSIVPPPGGDRSDIGAVELAPGVLPTDAASWKMHGGAGSFPIDLPLTGDPGIECRSGGATNDYQVIVNFAGPVNFSPPAVVTSGSGSVASSTGNGTNQVTLNLTGVTNGQIITVALFDANDGANSGDVGVRMGVLIGDVNASRRTDAGDVTAVRNHTVSIPTDAATARFDVNVSGRIDAGDVTATRNATVTVLP